MNNIPIFSIITVCYNSAETIERTIKSVLSQNFTDYEYIIVDGGSSDSTLNIIKKYDPLFKGKMHWISEPDKGIYDAMNKGVLKSRGTIVGIVNSDDWLEPDTLLHVHNTFINSNCSEDSIYCGGIRYHKNGTSIYWGVNLISFFRHAPMFIMSGIRHPATFVPKKIYNTLGVFDSNMKLAADQDFILRCYFKGVTFIAIDKCLSNMSAGGLSTSGNKKAWNFAKHDRRILLSKHGKKGLSFLWLYYSWVFRNKVRKLAAILHLYNKE